MAFFFCRQNLCNHIKLPILKKYPFKANNHLCIFYHNSWKRCLEKRTSWLTFPSGARGSITVETAFVLPLFLFFLINLLSTIQILTCYSKMEAAIHQTAKKMAVYAGISAEASQSLLSGAYAEYEIRKGLGKDYLEHCPIADKRGGISLQYSHIMDAEECVDLVASYRVNPAISMMGFGSFRMINRCRMRAWTGYDNDKTGLEENGREQIVYLAETGEVYHLSASCTHLRLSVQCAAFSEVKKLRNENGGKYQACELCGNSGTSPSCYITEQGDRYHSRLTCSGLKRVIRAVPISQVGARPACSRCGG